MSRISKPRPRHGTIQSSAQLFGELGKMFMKPNVFSAQERAVFLNESFLQLKDSLSQAELRKLRMVVRNSNPD